MNHAYQGFEPGSGSGYNSYEDSSKSSNSIYNQRQTGSSIYYLVTTGSGTGSGTGPGGTKVDYRCTSIYDQLYTNC